MGRLCARDPLDRKLCRALARPGKDRDQRQSAPLGRTPCQPAAAHEFAAVIVAPDLKEVSESRRADWTGISLFDHHEYTSRPSRINQFVSCRLIFQPWKLSSPVRFNRRPGCFAHYFVRRPFWSWQTIPDSPGTRKAIRTYQTWPFPDRGNQRLGPFRVRFGRRRRTFVRKSSTR